MDHLKANPKALDLPLTAEQMASLDAVSKPVLDFPAESDVSLSPNFQHAGATVNRVLSELGGTVLKNDSQRY